MKSVFVVNPCRSRVLSSVSDFLFALFREKDKICVNVGTLGLSTIKDMQYRGNVLFI